MKWVLPVLLLGAALLAAGAELILFEDPLKNELRPGWRWIRENPEGWRMTDAGLEILVEPGNLWGAANDARNVLVRPLPAIDAGALELVATVENHPTNQYEQVNLVW